MATSPYLSICSGIGGLDLGVDLGSSGVAVPICYVEREATAVGLMVRAMGDGILPEAHVWSDLRTFGPDVWTGRIDGIVGGYPCQPFSNSGRKRGTKDPRHIFPEIARIIADYQPRWCFFENVQAHLSLGYFTDVKPTLEHLDYRVEEQVIKASDVGAPHVRGRLFILAVANSASDGLSHREIANTLAPDLASDQSIDDGWSSRIVGRPTFPPAFSDDQGWDDALREYAQGSPVRQPRVRGVVDGTTVRLGWRPQDTIHALGNAVVPLQAAVAWRLLWTEFTTRSES